MDTERLIHRPQCYTIDLSALCNSSNSIWKTFESHRWVKLSCENIAMCYVPFTLVIRLINCWDFIQIWYDNKMLSSQWDNDIQHLVYIIVSWYLLGIITRQGFLFSCSCVNKCTCVILLQCWNHNRLMGYASIAYTNCTKMTHHSLRFMVHVSGIKYLPLKYGPLMIVGINNNCDVTVMIARDWFPVSGYPRHCRWPNFRL